MTDYVRVVGGTEAIREVGARAKALGIQLHAQMAASLGTINGLDGPRPWGADAIGTEFDKKYNGDGGQSISAEGVKEHLQIAGDDLDRIGSAIMAAMDLIDLADGNSATAVNNVGP